MGISYQAILLIAFGGPVSPEDIRPFLARVLRGHPVPPERVEEVVRHYLAVGGRSPIHDITLQQARCLEEMLRGRGLFLPVYVGMRHSRPFLREALDQMVSDGVKRALGFILSPHRTEASWERYQKDVEEARFELGGAAPDIDYCSGWHAHPLFIEAVADRVGSALEKVTAEARGATPLVFTAHSVPLAMAARSLYVEQVEESSRLVAEQLGHGRWSVAYQSRSGNPNEPWLEPDIGRVISAMAGQGATEVVVCPIGFVCDHVEVLYDLDVEAKEIAEAAGVRFFRARSLNDHPAFIRMMAEVIEEKLLAAGDQPQKGKSHSG